MNVTAGDGQRMGLLQGRTAVVTGAAQGIGLAIARLFAGEGAAVLIADINEDGAHAAAQAVRDQGGNADATRTDVRDEAEMKALVQLAVQRLGALDVMVNNAGVPRNAPLTEMSVALFDEVVAMHLRGSWIGTREAAIAMREQGRGSIVNMSSISGKVGQVEQSNYSAAKAGIVGLTKAAAKELGEYNIRVNAIQPGSIRTERTAQQDPAKWAAKIAEVPLGREGRPEEIAGAALFLASDLASYVSGAIIEVTGGRYL